MADGDDLIGCGLISGCGCIVVVLVAGVASILFAIAYSIAT